MSPPDERSRSAGNGPATRSLGCKDNPTVNAESSALWRALADCPPGALRYAGVGWHVGTVEAYRDGFDAGYAAAEHAMEISWFALAVKVRRDASRPSYAELQRRRGEVA